VIPIRPPLGGALPLGPSPASSAARAVVDGFVALLAMAVEPLTGSSAHPRASWGGGDAAEDEDPREPQEPGLGALLGAAAQAPGLPDTGAAATGRGAPEDDGPVPPMSWTPLPGAGGSPGWTPMPAPNAEERPWRPTLPGPAAGRADAPQTPGPGPVSPAPTLGPGDSRRPARGPSRFAPVAARPLPPPRQSDEGVPTAPAAPVPHGRARARGTFPPGLARSTPPPAQRTGWSPGAEPPQGAAVDPARAPEGDVHLLGRFELGAGRATAAPGSPGRVGPQQLGPMATPITAERRAARYAQTAVATAEGPVDTLGPSTPALARPPLPALGRAVDAVDPARFITPFAAYERQQGSRTLDPARAPDRGPAALDLPVPPEASDPPTAEYAPPGSTAASRPSGASDADPEPDTSHGSSVAAVPPSEVPQGAADAPVDAAVTPAADPGGVAPPASERSRAPSREALGPAPAPDGDFEAHPVPASGGARAEVGERVRVQIDRDLAVEVSTRGQRVDVTVTGSPEAVQPLRDLGPELDAGLLASGFQLGSFEAEAEQQQPERERSERPEPERARPSERPPAPSRRSRFGRYA
jgi:hypothetical protein